MKYLSNYVQEPTTKLFKECGTFFAFDASQYRKGMDKIIAEPEPCKYEPGDKWVNIGAGGFTLEKHYDKLNKGLDGIHEKGMAQDIKDHGLEAIILRELANHEFCITYDITDTWEAVKDYPGIKKKYVEKLSRNKNYKINI